MALTHIADLRQGQPKDQMLLATDTMVALKAAPPQLPALEQVHLRHVRTLKHVPKGVRRLWGQCVTRAAVAAVWHNSEDAWTEWQMLPKAVLCAPPRQGRAHKVATLELTKNRCARWLAGERRDL